MKKNKLKTKFWLLDELSFWGIDKENKIGLDPLQISMGCFHDMKTGELDKADNVIISAIDKFRRYSLSSTSTCVNTTYLYNILKLFKALGTTNINIHTNGELLFLDGFCLVQDGENEKGYKLSFVLAPVMPDDGKKGFPVFAHLVVKDGKILYFEDRDETDKIIGENTEKTKIEEMKKEEVVK